MLVQNTTAHPTVEDVHLQYRELESRGDHDCDSRCRQDRISDENHGASETTYCCCYDAAGGFSINLT